MASRLRSSRFAIDSAAHSVGRTRWSRIGTPSQPHCRTALVMCRWAITNVPSGTRKTQRITSSSAAGGCSGTPAQPSQQFGTPNNAVIFSNEEQLRRLLANRVAAEADLQEARRLIEELEMGFPSNPIDQANYWLSLEEAQRLIRCCENYIAYIDSRIALLRG